MEQVLCQT